MNQVLEQRPATETVPAIDAKLNYLVNDGVKIFTEAGGAGALDKHERNDELEAGRHPQWPPAR